MLSDNICVEVAYFTADVSVGCSNPQKKKQKQPSWEPKWEVGVGSRVLCPCDFGLFAPSGSNLLETF